MLIFGKTGVGKSTLASAVSLAELEVNAGDKSDKDFVKGMSDSDEDSDELVIRHKN